MNFPKKSFKNRNEKIQNTLISVVMRNVYANMILNIEGASTGNMYHRKPVSFNYYRTSELEQILPSDCLQCFGYVCEDWFVKKCKSWEVNKNIF